MNQIPWAQGLPTFLATLPLLGAVLWNLLDTRTMRGELAQFRTEVRAEFAAFRNEVRADFAIVRADIASIRERLAKLEERDRIKLR